MAPVGKHYKVRLASGRILGPLDLERVRLLILKNQIRGKEQAREHPDGEWRDINLIPAIAALFLKKAEGKLLAEASETATAGSLGPTQVLPGATKVLTVSQNLEPLPELGTVSAAGAADPQFESPITLEDDSDKTMIAPAPQADKPVPEQGEESGEKTTVMDSEAAKAFDLEPAELEQENGRNISREKTVMFQRSGTEATQQYAKKKPGAKALIRATLIAIALGFFAYESFFPEPPKKATPTVQVIRPKLPAVSAVKVDPAKSIKAYDEGIRYYLADNVLGYREAATRFHQALAYDPSNVKALAMLASSYLNLIDSSNKDENYFDVISKLIEMSRAKNIDISETIIADVEFYITINKPEAAQNRIVEYTKVHENHYGLELFYYLALAFYHRGDLAGAARTLAQFPDQKAFSAKIFYLRGRVAEKLSDPDTALKEYEKAVAFNKDHLKSRLRISDILYRRKDIKSAANHLDYIVKNFWLLSPKDLAQGYYLHAMLNELYEKWDLALGDIEKASKLDTGNHDYLLEMYTLRAKVGASIQSIQKDARMYYFLSEGEKLVKDGKYQDALNQYLQARQANDASPIPPVKIGDMFAMLHDLSNARLNYKLATDRAPNAIEVWSKYMDVLIQSYEWEEAQKAMDKFRQLPVPQSSIDKAAADMYAKQGRHAEAQAYYRKAMSRDVIDPDVYIAYAKSLSTSKTPDNLKQASFFYALALRFDPLNFNALIGTAKCIAGLESIDRAITMLQDELQKGASARAELLSAIAEFQIQKGDWDQAQESVEQAKSANAEYAYPWKLQAQIYLSKEGSDKNALEKALQAFQSYSDRNSSDPSGYLERYSIFAKQLRFDKAADELAKIYSIYPKYPNLHYYKGMLYSRMGNHKTARDEFKTELANNSTSIPTLLALGKELIEMGDANGALAEFNKAMQTAPQLSEPKHQSGYANYLLKNYQGAIALYNAALAMDTGNPLIYKRLGLAYRDIGDAASAARAFRKYLEMEPDAEDRALFEKYR